MFRPGVSGNPGGRPKLKILSDAYRDILGQLVPGDPEGRTYAEIIALGQAREAIKGKTQAASEIGDRTEGKARQAIDITTSENPLDRLYQYFDEEHKLRAETNRLETEKLKALNPPAPNEPPA